MTNPRDASLLADPAFQAIRDWYTKHLEMNPGLRSQLAIYWDDRLVLDLASAGHEDKVFGLHSATKGAAALCLSVLIARGEFDLDLPLAHYWPEFGRAGKGRIASRTVLSHQAGLIGVDGGFTAEELCDSQQAAEKVAATRPVWRPGSMFGYHRRTIGVIVEELFRRIAGESIQDFFEKQVRAPLGIDLYLGLPQSEDHRFEPTTNAAASPPPFVDPDSLGGYARGGESRIPPNVARVRRTGPVANGGVGSAAGLAGLYAASLRRGGLFDADAIGQMAERQVWGTDRVLGRADASFAVLFQKPTDSDPWGSFASYGHDGANGSIGFADPRRRIALGYVRNETPEGAVLREELGQLWALLPLAVDASERTGQ